MAGRSGREGRAAPLASCRTHREALNSERSQNIRRQSAPAFSEELMPFVIAEPCIGVKDKSCVEVCPVNCIYEGEDQYYIHPDECIDCQACEAACPVQAIFPDNGVPEKWKTFIDKNRTHFENT
jgi:NAD-dependent dihydropyrimidine dehydrogenase PreA subunit